MKLFTILLLLCAAITLTACSKDESAPVPKPTTVPVPETTPATQTAIEEAQQVAKQVGEQAEQTVQQVKDQAVATVDQVKEALNSGQAVYTKSCLVCHKAGIAGAPKLGDKDAWAPRLANGMESLVSNAINGIGTMRAKGGHSKLTDEEVKAAVEYMVEESR